MTTGFNIESHFENKSPNVREIYDALITKVKSFGKFQEESHKTSIHLLNQTAFAGVATRKDYLLLTIKTDNPIKSSRVTKIEQVSRNRFHLLVKLEAVKEITRS
jgi:acetyl/propionyl-CoA carboxylase alpha subunit